MEEYGTDDSYLDIKCKLHSYFIRCATVAQSLKSVHAKSHLSYGAARRFRMLQFSFLRINEIASPDRNEPLQSDEQVELNMHLNSIYMHIRGVLDNLAWAYCHETGMLGELNESDYKIRKQIGLFEKNFNKAIKEKSADLTKALKDYKAWFYDLKDLRDPIAHRLPLYAIPGILYGEEKQRYYEEKCREAVEALSRVELDKAGALFEKLGRMGRYEPFFCHQEQNGFRVVPIIIQTEMDIDNLSSLATVVLDALEVGVNSALQ